MGPRSTPEKLETRCILTKQKYRPYQCCMYRLRRTELKTSWLLHVVHVSWHLLGSSRLGRHVLTQPGVRKVEAGAPWAVGVRHPSLEFLWGPQREKGWKPLRYWSLTSLNITQMISDKFTSSAVNVASQLSTQSLTLSSMHRPPILPGVMQLFLVSQNWAAAKPLNFELDCGEAVFLEFGAFSGCV